MTHMTGDCKQVIVRELLLIAEESLQVETFLYNLFVLKSTRTYYIAYVEKQYSLHYAIML